MGTLQVSISYISVYNWLCWQQWLNYFFTVKKYILGAVPGYEANTPF